MKRNELGDLVGMTRFRESPLELIVLSACQTAAGEWSPFLLINDWL